MRRKVLTTAVGTLIVIASGLVLARVFYSRSYRKTFGIWPWIDDSRWRGYQIAKILDDLRIQHVFGRLPEEKLKKAIGLALMFGHGGTFPDGFNPIVQAGLMAHLRPGQRQNYLKIYDQFRRSA